MPLFFLLKENWSLAHFFQHMGLHTAASPGWDICLHFPLHSQTECHFCSVNITWWSKCQTDTLHHRMMTYLDTLPAPRSITSSADLKSWYLLRILNLFPKALRYPDFTLTWGFSEDLLSEGGRAEFTPRPELHSAECWSRLWVSCLHTIWPLLISIFMTEER